MHDLKRLDETVVFDLRKLYHQYGYSQFKMSKFEAYDLYMQNKEFLVSDGIITFTDTDGTLMALKPDVTLSIVKNFRKENTPLQKVCYSENVYRISGAGHSYREIMQTGLECLGDIGLYEISEVLSLAAKSLGTISNEYVLDISNMGIVHAVLSKLQLSEETAAEVLRCMGEKNKDAALRALNGKAADDLLALMDISAPLPEAISMLHGIADDKIIKEMETMCDILAQKGFERHIHLDFSIISDRNYYNNYVFRGYVKGIPTAILAGGQYDRLMEKMNKQAKGVGFAVYLDQLELLDDRADSYDIDTVLLYPEECDALTLSRLADEYASDGVFLTKSVPLDKRYRKLLKVQNGQVIKIEENG